MFFTLITFIWTRSRITVSSNQTLTVVKLTSPEFLYSKFTLSGTLKSSAKKRQWRQLHPSIYIFVLPSPCFYFWSHDRRGRIPLSSDKCKYFGLPFKLKLEVKHYREAWPTKIYTILHEYQISRGFNPRTTDFAQSLQYIIFEVVPPDSRFQEVDQGSYYVFPFPGMMWRFMCAEGNQLLTELEEAPPALQDVRLEQLAGEFLIPSLF